MSSFSCRCSALILQKAFGTGSAWDTISGAKYELSGCNGRHEIQGSHYKNEYWQVCIFADQRSTVLDTCHDSHLEQLLPNNRDIKQASSHWTNRGAEAR